jgi:hypothetical protein
VVVAALAAVGRQRIHDPSAPPDEHNCACHTSTTTCTNSRTTFRTQARQLVELAQAAGDRVFMVNNTANFRKEAAIAAGYVEAGRLGKVCHVCVSCLSTS